MQKLNKALQNTQWTENTIQRKSENTSTINENLKKKYIHTKTYVIL